ncbi:hypothetical protein [Xanthomonas campestris]|uniref:hypothetical protein n=1 Tax=Xanthomonas campestris TaxID=339 RepID=UPI001C6E3BFA|nr:hypothetical protein [Xanthomonas campestris]
MALDEELLGGGVILSEWCSFIVLEADLAFVGGAHLASILTAVSGIETYLRSEYGSKSRDKLFDLIDQAPLNPGLKADLQKIRKYRNKWVHVDDPWNDTLLIEGPENFDKEVEEMAFFAIRCLRRTIYENPWI